MNRINRILAVVCFLAGVGLHLVTPSQVSHASSAAITLAADFFPYFISYVLMFSSAGLFVQTQIAINHGYEMEEAPETNWKREILVIFAFVMMIVYISIMNSIGFILSSLLFGTALMLFLRTRKWWHYLIYYASVGLIYYVFKNLLYVHLPALGFWIL